MLAFGFYFEELPYCNVLSLAVVAGGRYRKRAAVTGDRYKKRAAVPGS